MNKRIKKLIVSIAVGSIPFLAGLPLWAQTWNISTVDSAGDVGQFSNIAISGTDLFIGYYDGGTNKNIKFAKKSLTDPAAIFTVGTAAGSDGDLGRYLSMDVFGDDLYFTYMKESGSATGLKYIRRSAPGYTTGSVWRLDASYTGLWSSVKVDQNARVHVVYRNWGGVGDPCPAYSGAAGDGIFFHKWSGASGTDVKCSGITTSAIAGPHSLAIDSNNIPHIVYSYVSGTAAKLRYKVATFDAGDATDLADDTYTWSGARDIANITGATTDAAQASTWAGELYSSLVIDSAGNKHIVYYDPKEKKLKYTSFASSGDTIIVRTIDSGAVTGSPAHDVGKYCDLAIGPDNVLQVSYYDATDQKLKYARKLAGSGVSWDKFIIDASAGSNLGQYSSLVVDSEGFAHISYYDATAADLKYANNAGLCGNGVTEGAEQCDDGNLSNLDSCNTSCLNNPVNNLAVIVQATPDPVTPEGEVTLDVRVINLGPDPTPMSTVGTLYIDLPREWTCLTPNGCSTELSIPIGPLGAGQSVGITIVARVSADIGNAYTLAYLIPSVFDPDFSNNTQGVVTTITAAGGGGTTLTTNPTSISVVAAAAGTVTLSGGTAPYSIQTAPDNSIATAALDGATLTVTGVAAGAASVIIADSSATPQTATISITVTAAPGGTGSGSGSESGSGSGSGSGDGTDPAASGSDPVPDEPPAPATSNGEARGGGHSIFGSCSLIR